MQTAVTLALVGDGTRPSARLNDEEWNKPWSQRPQVELEVADDESLASVVERALRELGVRIEEGGLQPQYMVDLGLYEGEESRPIPVDLALVDSDGKVTWNVWDLRLIPYGELVRSVEAGAIVGDPRRVYLILREPIGDGIGIDWSSLLDALGVAWKVAEHVVTTYEIARGTRAVIENVRDRLTRAREAARRNMFGWAQRGAEPSAIARFLSRDAWSASTLAAFLGCSKEDAEALLALLGFAFDERTSEWRRTNDDEAGALLLGIYEEAAWYGADLLISSEAREEFQRRVEELLRTGERPAERAYGFQGLVGDELGADEGAEQPAPQARATSIAIVRSGAWEPCPACGEEVGSPSDPLAAFELRVNHVLGSHDLLFVHLGEDSTAGPDHITIAVFADVPSR
jgi:hypothetical protein